MFRDLVTRHQKTLHADQYSQSETTQADPLRNSEASKPVEAPAAHGLPIPASDQPPFSNEATSGPDIAIDPSMWAAVIDPSLSHPTTGETPYYTHQPDTSSASGHENVISDPDHTLPNGHARFAVAAADEKPHEPSQFG